MDGYRAGALACLAAAGGLFAYGAATGTVRVGFFLIVPFVSGTGLIPFAGMLLVFAAFVLWSLGTMRRVQEIGWDAQVREPPGDEDKTAAREPRSRSGGVVLIGPIPIVWGSDRRVLPWMVAAGLVLLLVGFLLTR